jgi:thiamine biosynthesis lipoprotein
MSVFDSTGGIGRREFLAFGAGAFVVAGLPFALRRGRTHPGAVRRTLPVMGTIAEFAVVHHDVAAAEAAIDAAMRELQRVERRMTRFTTGSDIGRANLAGVDTPVVIDPNTGIVVAEALRWAEATDGAFDPAAGGIARLWDVTHRHVPPPDDQRIPLAGRRLYRAVEIGVHRQAPVLLHHDPSVSLDLGAIAKGYGVDRAVAVLRDHGIEKALVDVGGDLYALGTAPDGEPWRIGIQDPEDARALAGTLVVADRAVATSGTYLQFFRWRGRRYHHLMDPATAAPRATNVRSLTISADSCMHADVAATALFGWERPAAEHVLRRLATGAAIERMI